MNLQNFFPGMGIEEQLETNLAVVLEQIDSVDRLRRHAVKIKNWVVVADCDKELVELRQTALDLRKLSGVPLSTPCPSGKTISTPVAAGGTESQDRPQRFAAVAPLTG